MIKQDADIAGGRISIHLQKGNFEACEVIISNLRRREESGVEVEGRLAIAQLNIAYRLLNTLEDMGYIYVDELEGIEKGEWDFIERYPQIGPVSVSSLRYAIAECRKEEWVSHTEDEELFDDCEQ